MDSNDKPNYFDAYYYASGCGKPYERSQDWLDLFNGIAGRIVQDIEPTSVMDAGCAMGLLVEALRGRGVEAYGMDISEYSIGMVHSDVKPYCQVGSITEPFEQRYDLIVSIEVLEHMSAADSERAVENFCQHTDDVLFSSTPFDYKEATHFNVQPPEYWAELFARHQFYRDVDFDASFITPWAVRYRRRNETPLRLIREYERKFWPLWKENTDLRTLILEMRNELSLARDQTEAYTSLANHLQAQLDEIYQSRSWKMLQKLHQLRHRIVPVGSQREAILKNLGILSRDS
jgi:hypothetical protein